MTTRTGNGASSCAFCSKENNMLSIHADTAPAASVLFAVSFAMVGAVSVALGLISIILIIALVKGNEGCRPEKTPL